jgi:hypothetical protein
MLLKKQRIGVTQYEEVKMKIIRGEELNTPVNSLNIRLVIKTRKPTDQVGFEFKDAELNKQLISSIALETYKQGPVETQIATIETKHSDLYGGPILVKVLSAKNMESVIRISFMASYQTAGYSGATEVYNRLKPLLKHLY